MSLDRSNDILIDSYLRDCEREEQESADLYDMEQTIVAERTLECDDVLGALLAQLINKSIDVLSWPDSRGPRGFRELALQVSSAVTEEAKKRIEKERFESECSAL